TKALLHVDKRNGWRGSTGASLLGGEQRVRGRVPQARGAPAPSGPGVTHRVGVVQAARPGASASGRRSTREPSDDIVLNYGALPWRSPVTQFRHVAEETSYCARFTPGQVAGDANDTKYPDHRAGFNAGPETLALHSSRISAWPATVGGEKVCYTG